MQDIIGRVFGNLTVISQVEERRDCQNKKYYQCICICGNSKEIRSSNLIYGHTKSCGCLIGKSSKGRPSIDKSDINHRLQYRYKQYENNAKQRKLVWAIEQNLFNFLITDTCYYCGLKHTHNSSFLGLDRVDNSRGYELDNVVSCCKMCNRAKGTYTEKEFIALARNICKNYKGEY